MRPLPVAVLALLCLVLEAEGNCGHSTGEFYFLVDNSNSGHNAGKHTAPPPFVLQAMHLMRQLSMIYRNSTFGVGSYNDKKYDSGSPNYCYKLHQPLTSDIKAAITATGEILDVKADPTSRLSTTAAMYASLTSNDTGWSDSMLHSNESGKSIFRVLIVLAGKEFGIPGDALRMKSNTTTFAPHPGRKEVDCELYDYPEAEFIKLAAEERKVIPLFVLDPKLTNNTSEEAKGKFEELNSMLGQGGIVTYMSNMNIASREILKRVREISCNIKRRLKSADTNPSKPEKSSPPEVKKATPQENKKATPADVKSAEVK